MTYDATSPKPGDLVRVIETPVGLLDGLPIDVLEAITVALGAPLQLNEYDEYGRAELQFRDRKGTIHFIWVEPQFIVQEVGNH